MSAVLKNVDTIMEMMAGNAVGQSGGFSGKADAEGPVAGYDKPLKRKSMQLVGVGQEKSGWTTLRIVDQNLNTADHRKTCPRKSSKRENSVRQTSCCT